MPTQIERKKLRQYIEIAKINNDIKTILVDKNDFMMIVHELMKRRNLMSKPRK